MVAKRILILFLFLFAQLGEQSNADNRVIPKCADISINNIYLRDSKSAESVLGKEIQLNSDKDLPDVHYYNKNNTEILTLVFHPGDIRNSFSEFKVRKFDKKIKESIHPFKNLEHFVTGKNIKIGITKSKLIKTLGKGFTSEIKNDLLIIKYEISNFEDSEFLKSYNMPTYYGEYKFKNNRLIEFSFGFEYP